MTFPEATGASRTERVFPSGPTSGAMLEVQDLRIHFPTDDGLVKAVDGISFALDRGRTLGIVGESGSGKSVTSLGIMGLHHGGNATIEGKIWLDGEDLVGATAARVRQMRGSRMAMIFQDPLSSLHPFYTVGAQIAEAYLVHNKVSKKARAQSRDRHARPGRHPERALQGRRLPASVLRRHAAACHDRHGAEL